MPRHPPYALNNLTNTQQNNSTKNQPEHPKAFEPAKMLASTVQFSTNNQPPPPPAPPCPHQRREVWNQGWPCTEKAPQPPHGACGPAPSGPNSVPTTTHPPAPRSPHPPEGVPY